MNENENKSNITLQKKHLTIIIIVAAVLFAGGITLGMNWNNWFGDEPTADIDPNAKDYEGSKPKDEGGASEGIAIPGYPSIGLEANTEDVQVALLNPEGNPCYFTFELVLKDSGEVLYTSKQVPPGKAVTDIKLSRALEPGDYPAVIKITTASLENQSPMNGANVETVLIVR